MASKQLLFKAQRIKSIDSIIVPDTKVQDVSIQQVRKGNSKPKIKPVNINKIEPEAEVLNQDLIDKNDTELLNENIDIVDTITSEDNMSIDSIENFTSPVDQNFSENDDPIEG